VLAALDEEDVLPFKNIESLRRVDVDVQRGTEVRRLGGLEQRERAARLRLRRLHGHAEAAKIDRAPVARSQHERSHQS